MGGISSRGVNSLGDIQPGDHIKYHRLGIVYAHHAIVVNVNATHYTVIHFDGDNNNGKSMKASIQLAKRRFGEESFEVLDYPSDKRFTKEETVAIAYFFLRKGFGKYNLFGNNCEHFATTCATGYPCSIQQLRAAILISNSVSSIIAYCNTKKIVSVEKVREEFVIKLLKE